MEHEIESSPEEKRKLKVSVFLVVAICVMSIITALVILEGGLRIYYYAGNNGFLNLHPMRSTLTYYENDSFGHALSPNQSGWFVPESHEYQTWVETNSQGWPDREHTREKPKETYRILIVGDSFVENLQVPFNDRFFIQLEDKLKTSSEITLPEGKSTVEVIAMGRGNTGTAQQYLFLRDYGLSYKPDLVLHMFLTANDVKNNSPILQNDPYLPYFNLKDSNLTLVPQSKRSTRPLSQIKDIVKKSRIVELILRARQHYREQNSSSDYPTEFHIYDTTLTKEYESAWDTTQELIKETRKLSEENSAQYKLVVLANNEQVHSEVWNGLLETYPAMKSAHLDKDNPDKLLHVFCVEQDVDCSFMLPTFREFLSRNQEAITHNHYEGHWNETGTNLAAEFLYERVLEVFNNPIN